jgi:hypothetical protein
LDKNYPMMTIRDALTHYFDISSPLSQDALKELSLHADNKKERNSLEILANVNFFSCYILYYSINWFY